MTASVLLVEAGQPLKPDWSPPIPSPERRMLDSERLATMIGTHDWHSQAESASTGGSGVPACPPYREGTRVQFNIEVQFNC